MRLLKRFRHLPKQERSLILQAVLAMLAVRLTLALLSVPAVQRLAVRIGWRSKDPLSAQRIVWAIRSVARFVPRSTCLVQALAAQSLLIRHGYRPCLTIGVTKDECSGFGAHAWVTCGDEVLIGGQERGNYTALLNLTPGR
jgi:hypothetical protein